MVGVVAVLGEPVVCHQTPALAEVVLEPEILVGLGGILVVDLAAEPVDVQVVVVAVVALSAMLETLE